MTRFARTKLSDLLDHIIQTRLIPIEQHIEMMRASPTQDADPLINDPDQAIRVELSQANQKREAFIKGLDYSYEMSQGTAREVEFDSRQLEQDDQAAALIEYLVRPAIASVRSEEVDIEKYLYFVSIDWPALFAVAQEAHIELDPPVVDSSYMMQDNLS